MILKIDDRRLSSAVIDTLRGGGLTILPCDTIYGIVGRAPDADARIRQLKGRGETNPFLMLIATVKQAAEMAEAPLDKRVTSMWPGPLTVVMKVAGGTVAVRLPADPFLRAIIRDLGAPIYSTSVNRSGEAPMWRIDDIIRGFAEEVDLIVDAGDRPSGMPSTILDVSERPYRILRQGSFRVPSRLLGG